MAVSGGQDSLSVLKLFSDLQPKWQWELAVAHCDHRWTEDEGMATHVQKVVETFGLPFFLLRAKEPIVETEAAARKWRYEVLTQCCLEQGYDYLVTGHTGSDRAETLLYNLIRGSGSDGLQALTWQRSLTPHLTLVRPLLNFFRSETQAICDQFKLPIWEDPANNNLAYARNRLRKQILPELKAHFNPQVELALAQTSEVLRSETEYLQQLASDLFQKASSEQASHSLLRQPLKNSPLALQRRVMRLFWHHNFTIAPTFNQIEELTALIHAPNGSRTSSFPNNCYAQVKANIIYLQSSR
ncbi:tRNA lysidine(34) synthetase TilS [Euhalothece natronophila]|uniref:tRNA lysidine(34) synthetase TilS n=1 Tax=Euhalothece natronophila TaxID=577489 RepID=UPI0028F3F1B1|nr:tRNA lysidine(34) synthetase TilS [Euhalothece natronophila]